MPARILSGIPVRSSCSLVETQQCRNCRCRRPAVWNSLLCLFSGSHKTLLRLRYGARVSYKAPSAFYSPASRTNIFSHSWMKMNIASVLKRTQRCSKKHSCASGERKKGGKSFYYIDSGWSGSKTNTVPSRRCCRTAQEAAGVSQRSLTVLN